MVVKREDKFSKGMRVSVKSMSHTLLIEKNVTKTEIDMKVKSS